MRLQRLKAFFLLLCSFFASPSRHRTPFVSVVVVVVVVAVFLRFCVRACMPRLITRLTRSFFLSRQMKSERQSCKSLALFLPMLFHSLKEETAAVTAHVRPLVSHEERV